jgi:hypothetical protein
MICMHQHGLFGVQQAHLFNRWRTILACFCAKDNQEIHQLADMCTCMCTLCLVGSNALCILVDAWLSQHVTHVRDNLYMYGAQNIMLHSDAQHGALSTADVAHSKAPHMHG